MDFIVDVQDLQLEQADLEYQRKEGFKPRKDLPAWPMTFPLAWEGDPFGDRNWRFHLSAWRMLDPLIREYAHREEPEFLRESMPIIMDWHNYHIEKGLRNRYSWYDMSAGQRAAKLAFFIERADRGVFEVSDDERLKLSELASAHFVELMKAEKIADNNHGIFQVLGLKLLARVVDGRQDAADFADAQFRRIMDLQFTAEGLHTENSPDYHFYTQKTLIKSQVHRHLGDPFGGKSEMIEAVKPWLVFPTGEIARVGDSNGKSHPLSVDPEPTYCNGEAYAVGDFTASGYAIVRSMPSKPQKSMLFVTGMAHNLDHKHADELSFELFEEGRFVIVDTGKYGYKGGPMRQHVISTDAHNTVGLRDRKLFPDSVELSGSLLRPIEVDGDAFVIAGALNRPGLFEQRRTIQYSPGSSMIITDDLAADEEREFVSSLHLAPDLTSYHREDGFDTVVNGRLMRVYIVAEDYDVEVKGGEEEPLMGWHSDGYLSMVPSTVVRAIVKGKTARVQWRIEFEQIDKAA